MIFTIKRFEKSVEIDLKPGQLGYCFEDGSLYIGKEDGPTRIGSNISMSRISGDDERTEWILDIEYTDDFLIECIEEDTNDTVFFKIDKEDNKIKLISSSPLGNGTNYIILIRRLNDA